MEFNIMELAVAFAGGVFGAAIGALPVWILCGLAVLLGGVLSYSAADSAFMVSIAWGSFLGPHTSFAGGCAAAAYAAKKGMLSSGKDICTALVGLNNPILLLIGGIFGILGYILLWLIMLIPSYSEIPWNKYIALAVILNMMITRLVFGQSGLFGNVGENQNRWIQTEKASWVIYQSNPMQIILLGLAIAIPASYFVLLLPNSDGIIFGFCTVALIFMQFGFKVPVTHHIALSATLLTLATGNVAWGITFGMLAAFLAELLACLFVNHGDTHIDPPTFALVGTFSLFPLLNLTGIFNINSNIVWLFPIIISITGYITLMFLRKESIKLNTKVIRDEQF